MAEVDMRSSRQARPQPTPRGSAPPAAAAGELKPRHTARPGITAAALNARFPAPTAPVDMPAPLPEAAAGEEAFDANLTFAMQVRAAGCVAGVIGCAVLTALWLLAFVLRLRLPECALLPGNAQCPSPSLAV